MGAQVVMGAMLQCSFGVAPSSLVVLPQNKVMATVPAANILDNKPKIVGNTIGSTTFNSGNTYPATYDALGRRYAVSAKLTF